jgi:Rap1a immunity proteins
MKYVIAVIALFVATGALAEVGFNGTQLYETCRAKKYGPGDIACTGYVRGFIDAMLIGTLSATMPGPKYCPPKEGLDATQARLIIEKYLRNNPEKLHQHAGFVAAEALFKAFPCP